MLVSPHYLFYYINPTSYYLFSRLIKVIKEHDALSGKKSRALNILFSPSKIIPLETINMESIQAYKYSRFNHADKESKPSLKLTFFLFFVLLICSALSYAEPIRPDFNSNTLAPNDDSSTDLVDLGFPINFFGNTFSQGYVNNNGNMTFDSALSEFTPFGLLDSERVIIAPFFADVDTEVTGSSPVTYGQGMLGSRLAFAANWVNVGCFSTTAGGFNSFQMIIIDRSDIGEGDFDIEFNYQAIDWESGTASDGNEVCEEGSPARIGYSNGTTTSFELAGSGEAGAFLDTNLDTGLIHNNRNSLVSGRYVFEVRNGVAPTGNHIAGTVFGNDTSNPLAAALIQICTTGQDIQCNLTRSNTLGQYQVDALNQEIYEVRAFPPAGTDFQTATIGPISLAGVDLNNQDIILQGPQPLPDDTTISPSRDRGNEPIVYWGDPLDLTTQACSGGNASFTLTHDDGSILASGIMQEGSANSGTYSATIPSLSPVGGHATVSIDLICPDGTTEDIIFSIYIDPSGIVQDTFGNPVSNATVTLYRSDSSAGPFEQVANGSDIMSPSNRTNPDLSTEQGLFGWDVITGFYTVRAEAEGCTSPNIELDYVETEILTIPPPVTDLELVLDCGSIFVPNNAPVSLDDTPDSIGLGQSIVINVLENDTDSDGTLASESITIVTPPANGDVEVDSNTGEITYTNNGSATTSDSFSYTVEDNEGAVSNVATVNITITEVVIPNVAPVAADDIVSPIDNGGEITINVLDNDNDSDGTLNPATVTIVDAPINGLTAVDLANGEIIYTHDGTQTTNDNFTYTVEDNEDAVSNIATVSITINEAVIPNVAPVAANDTVSPIDIGGEIIINVLANDSDSDGSFVLSTVTIVDVPSNGITAIDLSTGQITYTHDGSATSVDSFTYTVEDNEGAVSNTATVSITINEAVIPNAAPIAQDDTVSPIDIGGEITIDVLDNDADSDGSLDLGSVMIGIEPTNGTTVVDSVTSQITYTHNGSATTSDSFSYTVEDNEGRISNPATVNITINTDVSTEDGLIAHWLLDEGAGTTANDDSGNGHDGSLINNPAWNGNELLFDGADDYANVGTLDVTGSALTLMGWAQSDSLENCSFRDCRIISKATGTGSQDHYWMLSTIKVGTVTRLRFRLKTGGVTSTLIASSGDISNDELFHAAAVYDGTTMRLYKNGIEVGSLAKTGAIDVNNGVQVWIGSNPAVANSRPWQGLLADVRVYQKALTAGELNTVKDSYNTIDDVTAPVVSNIQATVTNTTATIVWDTNELSDSTVNYGLDNSYGLTQSNTTLVSNHSITLTGLSTDTDYHFEIVSSDGSNNSSTSTDQSFTTASTSDTTLPVVSAINVAVTDTTAVISWTTDEPSTGEVDYGLDNNYGSNAADTNTALVTAHSVTLSGLTADTDYYFDLLSIDASGNISLPADQIFTTAVDPGTGTGGDLIAHWLLDEGAGTTANDDSGNGHDGTLINNPAWNGNELLFDGADDYVNVGTLDVTGSTLTLMGWAQSDSLENCSFRDCRIISKATGTGSQDHYWMLSTIKVGTVTRLRFRLKTGGVTSTLIASSGDISNDELFHAAAVYDGTTMRLYKNGIEVGSLAKTGAIDVNNGVQVWIGSNPAVANSRPWQGLLADVRVYQKALTAGELNTVKDSYNTIDDVTAPVVSNIQATVTNTTATIVWDTNELSNSTVNYGLDNSYGLTQSNTTLMSSHSITLTSLTADTDYHFEIVSADGSSNSSTSADQSFTTATMADTTPPVVSAVNVVVTDSTAVITWITDEPSTGEVDYGLDNNYGSNAADTNTALVTAHSVILSGLTADTDYYFDLLSIDASGNISLPADQIFTTAVDPGTGTGGDLIAHWLLDEGAGTTANDDSGNGHNGSLINNPAWNGGELLFDGADDYVNVGTLNVTGSALTLMGWAQSDSLENCSFRDCRIISKATGTGSQDHYWMLSTIKVGNVTRLRFRLKTGGVTSTLIASSGDISNDELFHAAAVYDGTTMRLYKNGIEIGSLAKTGTIDVNNGVQVWIGSNPTVANSRPWQGLLADVRVYQKALTATEVNAIKDGNSAN